MLRKRGMFEPSLIKSQESAHVLVYGEIDSNFESWVRFYNLALGKEVAQIRGA